MSAQAAQPAQVRLQHLVEELCAASIRALSGQPDVHFRGRRLHRAGVALPLFAPHLHPTLGDDDFASFRGAADGLALRLRLSDPELHRQLCPAAPVERLLFELLEQIRVESQVPAGLGGVAANLRHRFAQWSLAFHRSGLTDSMRGILLCTVAQICRARVTGEPVLHEAEDLMEATRAGIAPLLGHALAGLRRYRHDQAAYAGHALELARLVADLLRSAEPEATDGDQNKPAEEMERAAFSLMMDFDAAVEDGIAAAVSGRSRVLEDQGDRYRVFTTAYDREVAAGSLVRPALLREYREQLDRRIAGQGVNTARLARELKLLLARPVQDGWDSGQEEGRLDGRRIAQLIASPTERRLFRTERLEPQSDSVLSFLIDCSGSMKQHIESVAMLVDVLTRALEQAGVSTEILGFSTGAWQGGRAQRDWLRLGKPQHPGRLNEVSHTVFKNADTPWRRARPDIAALLKPDLFREGIDGEAVTWACTRLKKRTEARRILLVISDGCPMDGATQLANDAHYLDNHLKQVVAQQAQSGEVAVFGVGVGLDLSPFYP
ncbi:MAG: cobalt chelatase, partial [Burkholderiales bacterium]|nr:cobalt chelatase [Burkholderiales bacterium]